MTIEGVGIGADDIVKILAAGASGLAFLLSLLAFLMVKKEPDVASGNALKAYMARLEAMKLFLGFTAAMFVITCIAQYFLERRENAMTVAIEQADSFADLQVDPIKITKGMSTFDIPGKSAPTNKASFKVKENDQVELNVLPLTRRIADLKRTLGQVTDNAARTSKESGY